MIVQRTWTELVSKNPMLVEITRFRRKFLSFNGNNTAGGVILGLIGIIYLCLVTLVVTYRSDISPLILVSIQTVVFVLLAPTLLHSAISGERERRSWDLLLAAPITKAQIVAGKFIGALSAVGIGTAVFAFPIGVTALSYWGTNFWDLGLAELVCLSFTILVCSITIFFSARVKSSFMALGATLGVLAISLVCVPVMFSALLGEGGSMGVFYQDTLMYLHPALVFERIQEASFKNGNIHNLPNAYYGIPQVLIYLGLSAVILGWAINTLNFAENEVKFIPKAKS